MAQLNMHLHIAVAAIVFLVDVAIVVAIVSLDKVNHIEPPASGTFDMSAPIGWFGVLGAVFIFGCYGILVKTPSVQEAKCDCMVFQCYYSFATAFISILIWTVAASNKGLYLSGSSFCMGLMFSVLWIISQVFGYNAIQAIGYAVGPAIWGGVTICTSFAWGVAVFNNPVHYRVSAGIGVTFMVLGVCLAAMSSIISDKVQAQHYLMGSIKGHKAYTGKFAWGIMFAILVGLCNGTLMVSLACFQKGCPSIGVQAYTGPVLAPLAFLPSLAIGILVAQPVLFFYVLGSIHM